MKPMNGMTHHMENSVSSRNALERGLAMVRMVRRSSPHLRKKFVFQERDSTWKVSLLTGKTAGLPSLLMESLEENYEES